MSSWVVEAIIQFIKSPLWTVPVNNFIDEHCVVFHDEDPTEMKNEYNTEYLAFQELIDSLLTTFMDELAVPAEEVLQACKDRLALEEAAGKRNAYLTELIEYITYLSDFRAFFTFMRKRNSDLQVEMAEELSRIAKEKKRANVPTQPTETNDERELRLAIEASLADAQLREKQMEAEDAELQKALALSVAAEEERLEAQRKYLADCAQRADEAKRREAEVEMAKLEAQRASRIRQMEEATLLQRQENVRQHKATLVAEGLAPVTCEPVPHALPPAPPVEATAPPLTPTNVPDVVHSSSFGGDLNHSSSKAALPDLGQRRATGGFGFGKALPSIQPSLKELTASAPTTTAEPSKPPVTVAAAQVQVNRHEPSAEELENRAREMRELRARLVEAKKATRNAELENYKNGAETASTTASGPASVDASKQVTVELARRLRADLVSETKKSIN